MAATAGSSSTAPRLVCILCENDYDDSASGSQELQAHLLSVHYLVVAQIDAIPLLPKYLQYWRARFCGPEAVALDDVLFQVATGPANPAESQSYYLLGPPVKEDAALREELRVESLDRLLAVQVEERKNSSFTRECLFCRSQFVGNREELLTHMSDEHSFYIGEPDNLVHVDQFIDLLRSKLDACICLLCEKTFKDARTLAAHAKKKGHRRINEENHEYDRFYLVNAGAQRVLTNANRSGRSSGRGGGRQARSSSRSSTTSGVVSDDEGDDGEFEDFDDPEPDEAALCLYCTAAERAAESIVEHMNTEHGVDLAAYALEAAARGDYVYVKAVNYVRSRVAANACPGCDVEFAAGNDELLSHLGEEGHWLPGDVDCDGYLVPVLESDPLLYYDFVGSEGSESGDGGGGEAVVSLLFET